MEQFYDAEGAEREFHETIHDCIEMTNLIRYIEKELNYYGLDKDFEITINLYDKNNEITDDELLEEDSCDSQDE